jgi:hypothetical protein
MRARQRHFNPGHSGAKLALDSRFISGLSNGSAITTWSDRSGQANDATQSNSSFRPTFQTNVQGGNPATRYNGTNQRFDASTIDARTFIVVFATNTTTALYRTFYGIKSNAAVQVDALYIQFSTPTRAPTFARATTADSTGAIDFTTVHAQVTNLVGSIFTGKRSATSMTSWVIGAYEKTDSTSNALITADGPSVIGAGYFNNAITDFYPGDIFMMALYDTEAEKPLIKRLEHSAAFSFKIACS